MNNAGIGLYIHIPYCKRLCPYCGFYKLVTQTDTFASFISALGQEMAQYSQRYGRLAVRTVYVGGGTPSELPTDRWDTIGSLIRSHFDVSALTEFTVEMNPESVTPAYLAALTAIGVNRISLGVQSMREADLQFLGRCHTADEVRLAAQHIRVAGIHNWNMDLMYALPESEAEGLLASLNTYLVLSPTHISIYGLTIEAGTKFERLRIQPLADDTHIAHYNLIQTTLISAGFGQYEYSAFARLGYESRHNLGYWEFRPYIGIGPGAHSFFADTRYANSQPFKRYLENPTFDLDATLAHPDSRDALMQDFLAVRLRLVRGLDLADFRARFGCDFLDRFAQPLSQLVARGFLSIGTDYVTVTPSGWHLIDEIVVRLLENHA